MNEMMNRGLTLQGESASGRLLRDLNSRGWTVVDLAELARKADALEVVQILADYCKGTYMYIRL